MAFHISNLGKFGSDVTADIYGYVPTEDTTAFELSYDHGSESTHDDAGNLTDYGAWWQNERFPEIKAESIKATELAEASISDWQNQ